MVCLPLGVSSLTARDASIHTHTKCTCSDCYKGIEYTVVCLPLSSLLQSCLSPRHLENKFTRVFIRREVLQVKAGTFFVALVLENPLDGSFITMHARVSLITGAVYRYACYWLFSVPLRLLPHMLEEKRMAQQGIEPQSPRI